MDGHPNGLGESHALTPHAATANASSKNFISSLKHAILSREGLFIGLVFLLGFIVRAHLMRYELFFEFDSYWHARMVSYILQELPAPSVDPLVYYQNIHAATFGNPPLLFWYISAAIYKLFTLNAPYHFELWVLFVKILPALYGALICVAMYFLGKAMFQGPYEKTAGLFAGLLAAVVPSFVYRTMGGFFEDDSLGFLWMVLGFVFFVRAVRDVEFTREKILHAVYAGISFGLMSLTWSGFNQVVPILLGVGFLQFVMLVNENALDKAKQYAALWGITFGLFAVLATIQTKRFWLDQFGGILGGFLFRVQLGWVQTVGVIIALFAVAAILWYLKSKHALGERIVKAVYTILVLGLLVLPLIVIFFNVSLQTSDVLGQTVGEESQGKNFFGNKYSLMIIFAFIGLPAMAYLLYKRSRCYAFLAIPLVWLVVTFFMAWGKLKFTYYWGLPLALTGAVVFILAMRWMSTKTKKTQKIVALGVGMLLLGSLAAGTIFVTQNVPNIEASPEWKTALFWAEKNLPENTKFFNWWDEGHWISFLTGKKVLIDNRNADTKATTRVAQFILETDENKAHGLVEEVGSTHLIFGDDLLEKMGNLGFYAYDITSANDPRIQNVFGTMIQCQQRTAPLTREVTVECGPQNKFTLENFKSFPTQWQSQPNQIQQGTPLFVYRTPDNAKLFAFSSKANETMLVRLWFSDPLLQPYFNEVYRNSGVRIYEVKESQTPPELASA